MKPISFLGLKIERKTDFLAFFAFVMAILSAIFQLTTFLLGAEVSLIRPRQVVLIINDNGDLAVTATVAFTNSGAVNRNSVILNQYVTVEVKGREPINLSWHQFVTVNRKEDTITISQSTSSHPFVVNAGGAQAHEILFISRPNYDDCSVNDLCKSVYKNYISKQDFIDAYDYLLTAKSNLVSIPITFHAETINDGDKKKSCLAQMTDRHYEEIKNRGSAAMACT